jgi:FkbM family methyltransferase
MLRPFGLQLSYRIGRNALADMKRLLSKFEVKYIIDGGAHQGDFSSSILTVFPQAHVYAFEPQNSSWELLRQAAIRNPSIKAFQCALGAESGTATFHINKSTLTSSLLPSSKQGLKYHKEYNQPCRTEMVQVVSLKEFLAKESLPHIDILKLDLQGYELQALKGLGDFLSCVKLIYTEVNFLNAYDQGCLFTNLSQYLQEHQFEFYQFYHLVTSPLDGRLLFGDAIFFSTRFVQ